MDPNTVLLNGAIEDLFNQAHKILSEYEDFINFPNHDTESPEFEDDMAAFDERMDWVNSSLFIQTAALAEKIGLTGHAKEIRKEFGRRQVGHKNKMSLSEVKRQDRADAFYSPALQHIHMLYAPIASLMSQEAMTSMDVLERILKRTPEIVDKGLGGKGASKEKEVEKCLFEILSHSFPDASAQIAISQRTKKYVMDLGVHSLMAGIEVKFAKDKAGFNKVVGEIYTDMKGYSGDFKWRKFHALIYLKNHISDAEKLFGEFKDVKAPINWIPIIVTELNTHDP